MTIRCTHHGAEEGSVDGTKIARHLDNRLVCLLFCCLGLLWMRSVSVDVMWHKECGGTWVDCGEMRLR